LQYPEKGDDGATMTEVMRSKAYYARGSAMVLQPTHVDLRRLMGLERCGFNKRGLCR
jgi:hypothetical protein